MTTGSSSRWGHPEAGGAGKGLLIFLGIVALLGFGVWILWRPVFQPMIGEAIPQRVEVSTAFPVPAHDPQVILAIEQDWVVQRGLFDDSTALVRTPDHVVEITVDTWDPGAGPSLEAAIREHLGADDGADPDSAARTEHLGDGVVARSVFVGEGPDERLLVAIGHGDDLLDRAVAFVTARRVSGADDLSTLMLALAAFFAGIEVPE